ncbi:hypothetical protein OG264_14370 [Streptomyces xanthophaeus]|uniref:hypothetical protein n=1 Tax=Streptomyces xanthophaeus TaxID=67385 RepID=UPI00386DE57C|nr:hypothetical protein OG264_14370 [Streptomyces xanthophaeus]WST62451.1 hypothetical protein OG605_24065 [Streptomyces xanthophaeus]
MAHGEADFGTAWRAAPQAVRRALQLAHEALTAGGPAVGAVLTDAEGTVLAEGPRARPTRTAQAEGPCGGRRWPTPR